MSTMMLYTELDAVNDMLELLGEVPVSTLDEDHPMVPTARRTLQNTNSLQQAREWWFNVEMPTLVPQTDGKIYVPNNTASIDSLTEYPRLAVKGNILFNLDKSTDQFTSSLQVRLHRVVDFEETPLSFRAHVAALAKAKFARAYDGDQIKLRLLQEEVRETKEALVTESIRNAKVNLFNRPGVMLSLQRIRGQSANLWPQNYIGDRE